MKDNPNPMSDQIRKVILGSAQFGLNYGINNLEEQLQDEKVFQILDYGLNAGIKYVDTAAAYGDAENKLGKYIENTRYKDFNIITKITAGNPDMFETELNKSLKRLRCRWVDTVLFHSLESCKNLSDHLSDIIHTMKGRYFNHIGVSIYTNEELQFALELEPIEVIQLPFNLLDNEGQRGQLLRIAKNKGKVIHARSVFLQGLFFMDPDSLTGHLRSLKPNLVEIRNIAKEENLRLEELCLVYVMSKEYIDGILIGVDSLDQLYANLGALNSTLRTSSIQKIDSLLVEDPELLNPSTWKVAM